MTIISRDLVAQGELKKTHKTYDAYIDRWKLWAAAYDGGNDFIDLIITRHERESSKNHQARVETAECFNYSGTVIDLFGHFLQQVNPERELAGLDTDEQWQRFVADCDLYGTDYEIYWQQAQRQASVYGFVGILVDKPPGLGPLIEADQAKQTRQQELDAGVYPYLCLFTPENIRDWKWEKDPVSARPTLTFLKLFEQDGSYLIWTLDEWERWSPKEGDENEFELAGAGPNPLKEIPFVWFTNYLNLHDPHLGISDIRTIARIQAAITRDLSHGAEVIKYAAFPMMRKPMRMTGGKDAAPNEAEDAVGVTAILEFDPDLVNGKPDWLEAKVKEPIDAILIWLEKKVEEIYRTVHLSSIHGQSSIQAKSGVALKYEFSQLSAVMASKGRGMDEAEMRALYFWLRWQNQADKWKAITIRRPNKFNIDDLSVMLENFLIAKGLVRSDTFSKLMQKKIVRAVLYDEKDEVLGEVDNEIDTVKITDQLDDNRDENSKAF